MTACNDVALDNISMPRATCKTVFVALTGVEDVPASEFVLTATDHGVPVLRLAAATADETGVTFEADFYK